MKLKLCLTLITSLCMVGCGEETKITHEQLNDGASKLILIKDTQDSVLDYDFINLLRNTLLLNFRAGELAQIDRGVHNQVNIIREIEARKALINGLKINSETKSAASAMFDSLIEYHNSIMQFENTITKQDLWDYYSQHQKDTVSKILKHRQLKVKYEEQIKPFEDKVSELKTQKEKIKEQYWAEHKRISHLLRNYVIENELPISISKIKLETTHKTHKLNKFGNCPIIDTYKFGKQPTVYNEQTNKCHFVAFYASNDNFELPPEFRESAYQFVDDNSELIKTLTIKIHANFSESEAARKTLAKEMVLANNKYEEVGKARLTNVILKLNQVSHGIFNNSTMDWDLNHRALSKVAPQIARQKGAVTYPQIDLSFKMSLLYHAHSELAQSLFNDATTLDNIDNHGYVSLAADDHVNSMKVLSTKNEHGYHSYTILDELGNNKDGVRLLGSNLDTKVNIHEAFAATLSKHHEYNLTDIADAYQFCTEQKAKCPLSI